MKAYLMHSIREVDIMGSVVDKFEFSQLISLNRRIYFKTLVSLVRIKCAVLEII